MAKAYTINMKELQHCKDGAITDLASFQTKLQGEMKQLMTSIMKENTTKLEAKMDATIINHDAHLNMKTENIKQDIKTTIFLELQQEQSKIKKELSDEMTKTKDKLLIDITAGVNTYIISKVEDLRQEMINEQKSSTPPPNQHNSLVSHNSFE